MLLVGCLSLRQGYDIEKDPVFDDFTSEVGLLRAIELVLRLSVLGLLYAAIPCQSFGFMSSNTHGRSGARPWGEEVFEFVEVGSICACRFAILALLGMTRKCVWMIENPSNTTLHHIPSIQLLLRPELRPRSIRWIGPQSCWGCEPGMSVMKVVAPTSL